MSQTTEDDWLTKYRERVNCCACGGSLQESPHVNLVLLTKRATWKHPTGGNVLTGYGPQATAAICDRCVEEKDPIKLAVELDGDEVIYHRVAELEDLPPEPTYVIHKPANGETAIECLRCGSLSFHPIDVEQKYCGHCHRFHEG